MCQRGAGCCRIGSLVVVPGWWTEQLRWESAGSWRDRFRYPEGSRLHGMQMNRKKGSWLTWKHTCSWNRLTWAITGLELDFGVPQVVLNDNAVPAWSVFLLDRRRVCRSDGDEAKKNEQLHLAVGDGVWLKLQCASEYRRWFVTAGLGRFIQICLSGARADLIWSEDVRDMQHRSDFVCQTCTANGYDENKIWLSAEAFVHQRTCT